MPKKPESSDICIGIDSGSVSVNIVVIQPDKEILEEHYIRHKGRPVKAAHEALEELLRKYPQSRIKLVAVVMMTLTFGSSIIFFIKNDWLQLALAVYGVAMVIWLYRVPSRDRPHRQKSS